MDVDSAQKLIAETTRRNTPKKVSDNFDAKLSNPHFNNVENRRKTIECRLNQINDKWNRICIGDIIYFTPSELNKGDPGYREITCEVVYVYVYPTFRDILTQEGLRRILPGLTSIEDGVKVYEKFYPIEEQVKNGIIGLELVKL